jgi:uncharacterized membrane protein YfcA
MTLLSFAEASAAVFVAAVFRGFSGFGFALAAVPCLGLIMSPLQAVPIVIVLQFVVGLSDSREAAKSCDWASLRWLALGAVVGSPLGTLLLTSISVPWARLAIGCSTLAAVLALAKGQLPSHATSRLSSFGYGVVAGVFNGLAAMPGPAAVTHYIAARLSDTVVRASLIMFFFFNAIIALASLLALGKLTSDIALAAGAGLPALWLGTSVGKQLLLRNKGLSYRAVCLILLSGIAAVAIMDALRTLFDFA